MGVTITSEGSFKHTEAFLKRISSHDYYKKVESIVKKGTEQLISVTPVDTGKTAASWKYEIESNKNGLNVAWINDNFVEGYYYGAGGRVPLVTILINGHATKSGYYVAPNDFVTPVIAPVIKEIVDTIWLEVNK